MSKKTKYTLLIIIVIETAFDIYSEWPWTENCPYSLIPLWFVYLMFFLIIKIPLGICLCFMKEIKFIGVALLWSGIIMCFICETITLAHTYVYENHAKKIYSDDVIYKFVYNGKPYKITLHGQEFEEYLDGVLSSEEKTKIVTKNVYEIAMIDYDNSIGKYSVDFGGNYKRVGKNQYVFKHTKDSYFHSELRIACIYDLEIYDSLTFRIKNDTLYGIFTTPVKATRIYPKR